MEHCYQALDTVTQGEKRTLARIYQTPQTRPLTWQDVMALFSGIGAANRARNGDVVLVLGGLHQAFRPTAIHLHPEEITTLRDFLHRCEWQAYCEQAAVDYLLMIDPQGARIHSLLPYASAESLHLVQNLDGMKPATLFYAAILACLEGGGKVVIMGQPAGFLDYIRQQAPDIQDRFQITIDADVSGANVPQCLAVARDALAEYEFTQLATAPR